PESHRRFREKYSLNFPLLTDEGGRAAEALGVLRENREKANRVTFLLDPDGRIAKVYPEVSPETHADEILQDAASL
ncbi:MAG: peroxiredoxin, partial [Actinomycetota bacterium]|nr:peroxiredoxin [Actinomycetota bacterium]